MAKEVTLTYHSAAGERTTSTFEISGQDRPAPWPLRARQLFRGDMELWQVFPGEEHRELGYERLDNEILAGLRLARLAARGGGIVGYPAQVSRLHGYEADSAEPFVLLYPYRGETFEEVGRRLLPDDQARFQVSLLEGLRWLGAAGIAHRALTPGAIRWDRDTQQAQITDFSQATVFGVPRTVAGTGNWAGPEQRRAEEISGCVSERDDVWGAGQIICYLLTGEPLTSQAQLAGVPDPAGLLAGVFAPPEARPDARELLRRLGARDPVPRQLTADPLQPWRERFASIRGGGRNGQAPAAGPAPAAQQAPPSRPVRRPARRTPWQDRPVMTLMLSSLLLAIVVVSLIVGVFR
jgi:serine/threonine protein kinase